MTSYNEATQQLEIRNEDGSMHAFISREALANPEAARLWFRELLQRDVERVEREK